MIIVSCAAQQNVIIDALTNCETYKFDFVGKEGIKLKFSVDTEDLDAAAIVAKQTIKATPIGSVLHFQITVG